MCARHWRMVPKPLQAVIYESYNLNDRAHWRENSLAGRDRAAVALPPGTKIPAVGAQGFWNWS